MAKNSKRKLKPNSSQTEDFLEIRLADRPGQKREIRDRPPTTYAQKLDMTGTINLRVTTPFCERSSEHPTIRPSEHLSSTESFPVSVWVRRSRCGHLLGANIRSAPKRGTVPIGRRDCPQPNKGREDDAAVRVHPGQVARRRKAGDRDRVPRLQSHAVRHVAGQPGAVKAPLRHRKHRGCGKVFPCSPPDRRQIGQVMRQGVCAPDQGRRIRSSGKAETKDERPCGQTTPQALSAAHETSQRVSTGGVPMTLS